MTKVLIDTDPGTDDVLAIMMALASPDLDVVGLTTVGGNARLADTTRNALGVLEYVGATDVPVYAGASRPLKGGYQHAYHVHGPAGLGVRLPSPRISPRAGVAHKLIIDLASKYRGKMVVIALGPLTNVAKALAVEPRVAEWTKEIVVMGGAVEVPGNVTPYAEFNLYNDPWAAEIVLSSGIAATLVGLDVTQQTSIARTDEPWVDGGAPAARLARRIIENWFKSHPKEGGYHLHDPLAVAAAIHPGLLQYRAAWVTVELHDPERRGQTVAAYGTGPVRVAVGVNVQGAKSQVMRLLSGDRARSR